MKYGCPNKNCDSYKKRDFLIRDGHYFRRSDSRKISRFKCKKCGKRFSNATFSLAKNQKKRRINHLLFQLLSSGNSMRRCAKILNVNPKTITHRLPYLAEVCRRKNQIDLKKTYQKKKVTHAQFDDLLTTEHTKMKPLSVSLMVDSNTRMILGVEVSRIPAFGLLAEKSRKKYGYRKSGHMKALNRLFTKLTPFLLPELEIKSDEHHAYAPVVRNFLPKSNHIQFKGGRGCIVGQGELKQLRYDPLFALNHTCAMLRDNIARLVRKTWSTTKKPQRLLDHLEIYRCYHNRFLINNTT